MSDSSDSEYKIETTKKKKRKLVKTKDLNKKNDKKEVKVLQRKRKNNDDLKQEIASEENIKEYKDIKKIEIPREIKEAIDKLIKEIEEEMLNGILNYLKNGIIPNSNPNAFMNAFTIVENIINNYDEYSNYLLEYHNKVVREFIEYSYDIVSNKSNSELIYSFIENTNKINFLIYWMSRIFNYMEKFRLRKNIEEKLCQISIKLYKQYFFDNIQNNIYKELNKLFKKERANKEWKDPKIRFVLGMLYILDLDFPQIVKENRKIIWTTQNNLKINFKYENTWFNKYFKNQAISYARAKAKKDIQNMSAPEYIISQLNYLQEESLREIENINQNYYNEINIINYKYLVAGNAEELGKMDTGFSQMFVTKKYEELKRAYKLFTIYPNNPYQNKALEVISSAYNDYILKRGKEIYSNKEITKDPRKFIPALIDLSNEIDKLIHDYFENNPVIAGTKYKSFSSFMLKDHDAIQLSNYTDFCMKVGFKGKTPEEINKSLNEIIFLFKCLSNKIEFKIQAESKMSKRLLYGRSISINYEKQFITKLKQESGSYKMIKMMEDLELNKKIIEDYKSSPSKGTPNGIKFNFQVISYGAWDINEKDLIKIKIPKFLMSCVTDFEKFYLKKYKFRALKWLWNLSKIEIQYLCFKNKNISISTLPQFLVLLLLEKHKKLTLVKISQLLECDIIIILSDIPGLVYNPSFNPSGQKDKGLILGSFSDQTKEIKSTDEIYFNENFICPRQRFQTLPLTMKKTEKEINQLQMENSQILKNQQNLIIKSTVARIMKSKIGKQTTHSWLVNETAKQIDLFRAQPQQIKENIEKLIEQNIIKRSDKDRASYEYIA